jgi:hypothetical protein
MTLRQINQQRSASISTIMAASIKLSEDEEKEAEESPEIPKPSEGTYQPADDPDKDKQKEAENAPIMPQPPTPP